jgi:hypothetical protein
MNNKATIQKNIAMLNLLIDGPLPIPGLSKESMAFQDAFELLSNPEKPMKFIHKENLNDVEKILIEAFINFNVKRTSKNNFILTLS